MTDTESSYTTQTTATTSTVPAASSSDSSTPNPFHPTRKVPLTVTASNVSYTVSIPDAKQERRGIAKMFPSSKVRKTILHDITLTLEPGRLVAIIGASGAGKTSLLNVLAGQVLSSNIDGDIAINGRPRPEPFDQTGLASYVMQDDVMMDTLTVRECIEFSARLRLGSIMSENEKRQRADAAIAQLGLQRAADTRVGSVQHKGISGGERKRAAIGVELVTEPNLIFLDEPTSGLDSHTAAQVVELLRHLAQAGRTVCCTIHQPSSDIFAKFDMLCLVAEGTIAYYGPANDAVQYFEDLGYECPQYSNPSDYFMDILATGGPEVQPLTHAWANSSMLARLKKHVKHEKQRAQRDASALELESSSSYATSGWTQFALLTARAAKVYARNPMLTRARLGQMIIFALLCGLCFWQVSDDQTGIQDRNGALFMVIMTQSISSVIGVVATFPNERALFVREHANRMYSLPAYYFGKTVSEFPWQLVFPLIFAAISYWMMGLQSDFTKFVWHYVTIMCVAQVGQSLGLVISAAVGDVTLGLAVTPVVIIPFILLSGFLVSPDNIPIPLRYLGYISLIKYGFSALAITEFEGLKLHCTSSQEIHTSQGPICPVTTGEQILSKSGGVDEFSVGVNILLLAVLFVVLRIVALGLLMRSVRKKN